VTSVRDDRFPEPRDERPGSPANGHPAGGVPRNGAPRNGAGRPALTRVLAAGDDVAGADAPIDLVAVQADDELVNALGARPARDVPAHDLLAPPPGGHDTGGPDSGGRARDDRLVSMLAAWRAEIDAEPIPELLDLDAAVAAVVAGVQAQEFAARRRRSGRLRHLAPLAAAAAIIVATVSGVGLGSQNAVPGDTLWPIQKVVNPERAESVEAKVEVESRLEKVRTALANGDTATAASELQAIRTQIPAVRGQEGQPQLTQEQEFLAAKLADTPPGTPADLTTPPKSNPAALPTGTPAAPSVPGVPPVDPAVTAPSESQSVTDPQPTDPDVRSGPVDRGSAPAAPVEPGAKDPILPRPVPPDADVTSAPEAPKPPKPQPRPDPTGPGSAGGGSGGQVDPSTVPDPVEKPAPSGTDEGTGVDDGKKPDTGSGTTTAAGPAAGADVVAPTTDTTT
jgi:hypothetical protein